jgi:type III secretion system low calcium response chaperone LcrH/SycD
MPKGGQPDYDNIREGKVVEATEGVNNLAAGQVKETLKMMFEALKRGVAPKQMLSVGDDTVEGLYTQAYNLYSQGKYKDASYIFIVLLLLDPKQLKFQLGSAACLHRLGKYEKAAQVYLICSAMDQTNPLPHFHAADCYIKLGALPLAEMSLKNALECCGQKPEHAKVREQATLMLAAVQEELADLIEREKSEQK